MANEICFRTRHLTNPYALSTYESVGGYAQWKKILKEKIPPADIVGALKTSALRGRGGGQVSQQGSNGAS